MANELLILAHRLANGQGGIEEGVLTPQTRTKILTQVIPGMERIFQDELARSFSDRAIKRDLLNTLDHESFYDIFGPRTGLNNIMVEPPPENWEEQVVYDGFGTKGYIIVPFYYPKELALETENRPEATPVVANMFSTIKGADFITSDIKPSLASITTTEQPSGWFKMSMGKSLPMSGKLPETSSGLPATLPMYIVASAFNNIVFGTFLNHITINKEGSYSLLRGSTPMNSTRAGVFASTNEGGLVLPFHPGQNAFVNIPTVTR